MSGNFRLRLQQLPRRRLKITAAILAACLLQLSSGTARAAQQGDASAAAGPVISGKVYQFEKITEGVYYATSTAAMATGGNHPIIVNDRDVLLVDDGTTPAAARALLQDLKLVTDKPVRWVVNTHFHYDHTDGNSVFGPEVEIIGHEYVRTAMENLDVLHTEPLKTFMTNLPIQIEALSRQIAAEKDVAQRATQQKQRAAMQADLEEMRNLKPVPPTMTYARKMTLHRGDREIQFLFLGRGHTEGDTIVYLPKERIVCTGDLMESRPAYMGNALFDEWISTLDALKELNIATVLPGHGVPFHEKSLITAFQSYLQDFMSQAAALRKQGVSPEEAAQKIDLTSHRKDFPTIQAPGAEIRGVRRVYQWMDERANR